MIDRTDRKILDLLSQNARMPFKQIAEEVGLTPPAVKSRMEKMEQNRTILGYRLDVDQKQVGYPVLALVSIAVSTEKKEAFLTFVKNAPEIIECYGITGSYFSVMKVRFSGTMDLDRFLSDVQKFGETSTSIVLSQYK